MNRILETSLLFDFYGELLTEKQRTMYEEVKFGDLSLSEAAALYGISRQGVHDALRRVEETLEHYEEKLRLVSQFEKLRTIAGALREEAEKDAPDRERLKALAEEIGELF